MLTSAKVFSTTALLLVLTSVIIPLAVCASAHAQAQESCPAKEGDCLEGHGGPGCTDTTCCQLVCDFDPICCGAWDSSCAIVADNLCSGLCGASSAGPCFTSNPTPSCQDPICCNFVCKTDPFCCSTVWDTTCVLIASFNCEPKGEGGTCGDVGSGDCDDPNGVPACNDTQCCTVVCQNDPTCCSTAWDTICVALANTLCNGSCTLEEPSNSTLESEGCSEETNDPCEGGASEPITIDSTISGNFQDGSDADVFEFELTDSDGDGATRLRIDLMSSIPCRIEVRESACPAGDPSLLTVSSLACITYTGINCLPPGDFYLRVIPEASPLDCQSTVHYIFDITAREYCEEPCDNPGDCLEPRESPGCNDPDCCALVCEEVPLCCEWGWDESCASIAAEICGGPLPVNDQCTTALPIQTSPVQFRHLLSTVTSSPDTACIEKKTTTSGDVWFQHTVSCQDELLFDTCNNTIFNTVIEIFTGTCENLQPVVCNVSAPLCPLGRSQARIETPTCGETLFIKVSGIDDSTGFGQLSVSCLGPSCECPGDLDLNGTIDGSDVGIFLSQWGATQGPADIDQNGIVNGSDFGILLASWGLCF